ncbi:hypothetical protein PR048_021356 [Dryococelus australis]|uniref:Uncharacterized protein n=1 Tax=Dryococelus australis TaxID=614101 RepID=A0ABQ9GY20_9NEOP|nr:hypothetical protein PR048_021356 [Dryococelus australis]
MPNSKDSDIVYLTDAIKLLGEVFSENIEAAHDLVHPEDHEKLSKFVKTKITGEAKLKLVARANTATWEGVREILEETYAVRPTLDYYACQMFNA